MEIPSFLRDEILSGDVILMLGAGASMGARSSKGNYSPSGKELAGLLSKKFLGGQFNDLPLNQVSELAINETDLVTVQEYIREIFEPLEPTDAHLTMTKFNWFGIATTNYDRLAELKLRLAEQAKTELERKHYLDQVKSICQTNSRHLDSYGIATLIKTELFRLERVIGKETIESTDEKEIQEIVKNIDTQLENGMQRYPGTHHLLGLEAQLAKLVSDSHRLVTALSKSFELNPRNSYVALWLSKCYREKGESERAREILEKGLAAKDSKELHYSYARFLLEDTTVDGDTLEYHFKRAYSPGDNNYDAQLLHARQLYVNGDVEGSKRIFKDLKYARLGFEDKIKPLYPLNTTFHGVISQIETDFGYIIRDGIGDRVYFHIADNDEKIFDDISVNDRIIFKIAFNMHGTKAIDIMLEREHL